MKSKTEILMLDKGFLEKQMAKLPGVPGAKEEEFCSKCGGKLKRDEPDDADDDAGDDDDDNDNMTTTTATAASGVPKKERSFLKMLVKKLFGNGPQTISYSPLYREENGISIIDISGEIGKRTNELGKVDLDEVNKALKIAKTSGNRAVILHINSPGGGSIGVEETGELVMELTKKMPVFAFTDTIMASAGYWLGSCTNGIYCTRSSELSSIGVYAKVLDYSKALEMSGINTQIFSAGEFKTIGQPELPLTEEECKMIQDDINLQWEKFKTLVRSNRGEVAEENMQGQLFSGEKAVAANLADELVMDLDEVINKIADE